jgi:gustatory receptor
VFVSKSCWGVRSAEEAYFRQSFTDFFASFKFNIYLGLFTQIVNLFWYVRKLEFGNVKGIKNQFSFSYILSAFAWNFIDVYLIIISVLLTEKFACINRRLENNLSIHSSKFWNEVWCGYKICVELVDRTNQLNGGTILISFFSNLYFICVQLLGCFKSESSILDGLYLWFSLIFLIGRTLALCLFASEINDESLKPLQTLRSIHSDYFDITMNRFTEQLINGKVALTGLNFFYLTRKLILSVS